MKTVLPQEENPTWHRKPQRCSQLWPISKDYLSEAALTLDVTTDSLSNGPFPRLAHSATCSDRSHSIERNRNRFRI